VFASSYSAQTESLLTWQELAGDSDGFLIDVPSKFDVFSYDSNETFRISTKPFGAPYKDVKLSRSQFITAYRNGVSILIKVYSVSDGELGLRWQADWCGGNRETIEFNKNGFHGIQCATDSKDVHTARVVIAGRGRVYCIFGGTNDLANPDFKRFFTSIRLGTTALFQTDSPIPPTDRKIIRRFRELVDTPFVVERISEIGKNTSNLAAAEDQKPEKNSVPLKLIHKPLATFTAEARQNNRSGTLRLKATFSAGGNISKIALVNKGLPDGLNEMAVIAARQIRFFPKTVDAIPVDVERTVEYSFSIR
jgi:TonB family protein